MRLSGKATPNALNFGGISFGQPTVAVPKEKRRVTL
jgi:hypothetical protein